MSYNFDFERDDGTEVLVTYRLTGGGSDYFANGHWNPGDPLEVWIEKVYGLADGEDLTEAEYDKIEAAILDDPPEPDYGPDYDD